MKYSISVNNVYVAAIAEKNYSLPNIYYIDIYSWLWIAEDYCMTFEVLKL